MTSSPPEAPRPLSNSAQLRLPLVSNDVGPVAGMLRAVGMLPRVLEYSAPDGDATLAAQAECVFSRFVIGPLLRFSRGPQVSTVCGTKVLEVALPRQVQGADGAPVIVSGCITRCLECDRAQ